MRSAKGGDLRKVHTSIKVLHCCNQSLPLTVPKGETTMNVNGNTNLKRNEVEAWVGTNIWADIDAGRGTSLDATSHA
jgi:hypothetical protein